MSFLFPNYTKHGLQEPEFGIKKQLARSKIDSNSKLLSSVCESFPSVLFACKIPYFACKMHSFHPNRPESMGILHH